MTDPHHSEELVYVDKIRQGLFSLALRQRVGDLEFLHSAEITIRLPGVPVNAKPYMELCEAAGVPLATFGQEKWLSFWRVPVVEPVPLDVVGHILAYDGAGVSGLVAKNPFYGKTEICESWAEESDSPLRQIAGVEHLVCELSDKHAVDDRANSYLLTRIEAGKIGRVAVLRPVATWDKLK